MEFSKRLKNLRIEKEMSQEELAKLLNISRTAITNYELGRNEASAQILNKLSKIFNCSIDYILGKTDIRKPLTLEDLNNLTVDEVNKLLTGQLGSSITLEEIKSTQFANAGGLDVSELDEDEIDEIKQQIEYMKWKKKNGNK